METEFIRLKSYANYLDFHFNISDLNSQILIQKFAYILENMVLNVKYLFKWWRHGPYSRALADDYYKDSEKNVSMENTSISDAEKEKLDLFHENVDMDVTLLEAISTIMFKDFVYSDLNEVIPHIKRLKPHLNERIMIRAQNKSKELLFHPEYLTDVLKKEIKE